MPAQAMIDTAVIPQSTSPLFDLMDVDEEIVEDLPRVGTPYEQARLKNIKRNRVQMRLLGLGGPFFPPKMVKAKRPKRNKVTGTPTV